MNEAEIAKFLVANVKPLQDSVFGPSYRTAAYLTDGTYTPGVVFRHPRRTVDLAIRRFTETRHDEYQHRLVVSSFVASKAGLPIYNVARVELSPYAWSEEILRQIQGETVMAWTAFTVKIKDGRLFGYGTPFNFEFFDLPEGYSYQDIVEVHSGMIVDEQGREKKFTHETTTRYYRERPFFYCHSEHLPDE